MFYEIKRKIESKRGMSMNKFKKAVIVCCTVLVIGVTGVYGGGKIISYTSSSSNLNEMKYIPSESEFTKKLVLYLNVLKIWVSINIYILCL